MAVFGILVGGGPAPGINGVIGAATILAIRNGARVKGLSEGFRWLMEGDTSRSRELQIEDVSRIHLLGGSVLQTSRANPTRRPEDLERVVASLDHRHAASALGQADREQRADQPAADDHDLDPLHDVINAD